MTTSCQSPTGTLWITGEDDGITSVSWQKPATTGPATPQEKAAVEELAAYFTGKTRRFSLLLSTGGTPFQQRVWAELIKIPYGHTRTYGEIAQALGSGPRAVGGAIGANPLPIFIPCHRVIGKNGEITGFSGGKGIATKEQLLKLEGAL